jgi:hypothetical protein
MRLLHGLVASARSEMGMSRRQWLQWLEARSGVSYRHFAPPEIATRDQFGELLNQRGLLGIAAEVGTYLGHYAKTILQTWRGERLLCIDPWRPMPEYYGDPVASGNRRFDYNCARQRLRPFGKRCEIMRMTSLEAAELVPDGSLAWAFIDANHRRPHVEADLAAWWPKIASGGIISGHDIICPAGENDWTGEVLPAVGEFAEQHGLVVHLVPERYWSWYCYKP